MHDVIGYYQYFKFHYPLCTHVEVVQKVVNRLLFLRENINPASTDDLRKEYMTYQSFRFYHEQNDSYNDPKREKEEKAKDSIDIKLERINDKFGYKKDTETINMNAMNLELASCWILNRFKYFVLMLQKMPKELITLWIFSSCNAAEKAYFKPVEYIPGQ